METPNNNCLPSNQNILESLLEHWNLSQTAGKKTIIPTYISCQEFGVKVQITLNIKDNDVNGTLLCENKLRNPLYFCEKFEIHEGV